MPRQSTVDQHPKKAEIIAALQAGQSRRSVALRYGLGQAAVKRYIYAGHVPGVGPGKPAGMRDVPEGATNVELLRDAVRHLAARDPSGMSPRQLTEWLGALTRATTQLGKLDPEPKAGSVITTEQLNAMEIQPSWPGASTVGDVFRNLLVAIETWPVEYGGPQVALAHLREAGVIPPRTAEPTSTGNGQ